MADSDQRLETGQKRTFLAAYSLQEEAYLMIFFMLLSSA